MVFRSQFKVQKTIKLIIKCHRHIIKDTEVNWLHIEMDKIQEVNIKGTP